jgi:hypothetical protein
MKTHVSLRVLNDFLSDAIVSQEMLRAPTLQTPY